MVTRPLSEAASQRRFRELVHADPVLYVPQVIDNLRLVACACGIHG